MAVVITAQFSGQFLMFSSVDYFAFAVGASLFGYGVGGVVPMHGAVVGKTFGRDRFGAVLGLMRPAMFPIQILGVPFAGWIFDVTGAYDTAFMVFLALYLLAALAIAFYRQPAKTVTQHYQARCSLKIAISAAVSAELLGGCSASSRHPRAHVRQYRVQNSP